MGIENPVHLLFIAIVALIVLGPKRLPEVARALGHGLREFREAVSQQADQTITQQPATPQPAEPRSEEARSAPPPVPPPPAVYEPAAPISTAPAAPEEVDPAEHVRSSDAPDRGPL